MSSKGMCVSPASAKLRSSVKVAKAYPKNGSPTHGNVLEPDEAVKLHQLLGAILYDQSLEGNIILTTHKKTGQLTILRERKKRKPRT